MKIRRFLLLTIIILCFSNIITVIYYNDVTRKYLSQLTVASNSSTLLKEELDVTQEELQEYQNNIERFNRERNEYIQKNQELIVTNQELEKEIDALITSKTLAEQTIKKYELLSKSSSVALEEKDIFIKELSTRIESLGGIDIFELPVRKKEYETMTIWLEDGAHETYADMAMSYINLLPLHVVEKFNEEGWNFIVTTRNIEDVYQSRTENTIGLTIYSKKRVYVLNNESYIASAVIHEFAHAYDNINGYLSYSKEWLSIYNEERTQSGFSEYFITDPREYFAECVQQYFSFPQMMRKKVPKSYQYIKEIMNKE